MAELDAELLERVVRWCAEAGRQAGSAQIRRALAPLSWDELLAVRALLADPPPARPLGPFALADLARGAPADVAAERERGGRYASAEAESARGAAEDAPAPAAPRPPRAAPRARARGRGGAPIIRRARDAAPPAPSAEPARPPVEELMLPEGRGVLERLVRHAGASRPALLAALAGWRRPAGGAPADEDLVRLLEHHGMTRAFERRERDGLLHAVRASGGVRAAAAARLGLAPEAFDAAVARLGAAREVEQIREERRTELRSRATLSRRLRLLLDDEARLRDLELLAEFEDDLRRRLPEHVRALSASAPAVPLHLALAGTLSLSPAEARAVAERFALRAPSREVERAPARPPRAGPGRGAPSGPRVAQGGERPLRRPAPAKPRGTSTRPRAEGARKRARPGDRPTGRRPRPSRPRR